MANKIEHDVQGHAGWARAPRDGFLILGMHRSGTSAIAGTLAKLGAEPPRTLLGANPGNPRGHWESVALMSFHDDLLASDGSTWDDWLPFSTAWYAAPVATKFRARAKSLLASEFGDSCAFVMKDPRTCRFSNFWLDIFADEGIVPRLIIPVRHPLEVAKSLATRDGSSVRQGLLMWLRHVLDAETATRGRPRVFVDWNAFLGNWRGQTERIAAELDVRWPRPLNAAAAEIDAFLSAELKREHAAPQGNAVSSGPHEWAMQAYAALLELARNPNSIDSCAKLDQVRVRFEEACQPSVGLRFFRAIKRTIWTVTQKFRS